MAEAAPVMPQEDNAGGGGTGHLPQYAHQVVTVRYSFRLATHHSAKRDISDDEYAAILLMLLDMPETRP